MFLIADLLDRAKVKANIDSDYRLSKVIRKTQSAISGYRHGKSLPDESVIEQLCALSGDDPDLIAAQIQAARAQTPAAKNLWLRVAARMAGGASTAILSVLFAISLIAGGADSARAGQHSAYKLSKADSLYIVSITILSVGEFLQVRLRQFQGFFRLWMCCNL